MDTSLSSTAKRTILVLVSAAVAVGWTMYRSGGRKSRLKLRPQTAHHSRRSTVSSDQNEQLNQNQPGTDLEDMIAEESNNLMTLLYSIAEDKAELEGVIHRSIVQANNHRHVTIAQFLQ